MSYPQDAKILRSDWENIYLHCPHCDRDVVLNRVSDLGYTERIAGRQVNCPNCSSALWAYCDTINEAHDLLAFEATRALPEKKYMLAVGLAHQAVEVCLYAILNELLALQPASGDKHPGVVERANDRSAQLWSMTKTWSYADVKNAALHTAAERTARQSVFGHLDAIDRLNGLKKLRRAEFADALALRITDPKVRELGLAVCAFEPRIRNDCGHKFAVRPHRTEAEQQVSAARGILAMAENAFILCGDLNYYMMKSKV